MEERLNQKYNKLKNFIWDFHMEKNMKRDLEYKEKEKPKPPKCVDCKYLNNEIDEETGYIKCYKNCPYKNTITLMEKWM